MKKLRTTDEWLREAWRRLEPLCDAAIEEALPDAAEFHVKPNVQLSVGYWPDVPRSKQPWAYCCDPVICRDSVTFTIFISPELVGAKHQLTMALGVLLHEMIHSRLTNGHGHNRRFQNVAHAAGFRAPYKHVACDIMSRKLLADLRKIGKLIGPCPWLTLRPNGVG